MATEKDSSPDKLKLKTEVGLLGGVSLIAGVIIGSGIFMSPQYVLLYIGSPGASLLIWAASGLLAMLASLCYAELGTVIRESGGEYIYILRTSGNIMAFICAFTSNIVMRPTSMIAVALVFAQNSLAPFYDDCPPPNGAVKCLAALGIMVLTVVNCFNVRSSIKVTVLFTAIKVLALTVIMIGGVVLLIQGDTSNSLQNFLEGTKLSIRPMGIAFYQCLWSYDGWNTLNQVTEEVNHPEVNLPRALMIAIPMVTILYLMVNVSYLVVLTPAEMISSSAVAVTWGNKVLGRWGWVMSVAAALSAFGSLNGSFFSGGRVCYVAAREGHMPDILAMAHMRRLTPSPALIFNTVIALIVLIPGDFQAIVNFFSTSQWQELGCFQLPGIVYRSLQHGAV
ncbi:hypothetical protein QQF64_011223, partial [Cirrhinus molitorella]